MFNDQENHNIWILPDDSAGRSHNTSGYRLGRKIAVDELGGRQRNKKWGAVAPMSMTEKTKKSLVWRDGMGDHVLSIYREEAWKRLDGLSRKYLYEVELDEDMETAKVGRRIPSRTRTELSTLNGNLQDAGETQISEGSVPKESKETTESKTTSEGKSLEGNDEPLHISAILYLGPDALRNASWEFKPIAVENQSTSATLFNLRVLFPTIAERYMNRLIESATAVAVQSSEISCATLYHMLRLAFYLEGHVSANMTIEERHKHEMGVGTTKFRKDQDDNEREEIIDTPDAEDKHQGDRIILK